MTTTPEPMATDDTGRVLWRVKVRNRDAAECAWCGTTTRHRWLREDADSLRTLGPACSVVCVERREKRPA